MADNAPRLEHTAPAMIWIGLAATTGLYGLGAFLFAETGPVVHVLGLLPVMLAAWYFEVVGGAVSAALFTGFALLRLNQTAALGTAAGTVSLLLLAGTALALGIGLGVLIRTARLFVKSSGQLYEAAPKNTDNPGSATESIDLMGTIIHELKTPISSIKSFADLVQQGGGLSERQERYLARINTASLYMIGLVNDLLDMIRLESGQALQLAPCNLLDIVREQMRLLEGLARERDLTIHLDAAENLGLVPADSRQLEKVIGNLLNNSIKYNQQGGGVRVNIEQHAAEVSVTIQDDGIGIPAEDLPRVFERFYRARHGSLEKVEGSGLGLYIAKAIVEQHGGTIGVESTPGAGSIFWFTLPT